MVYQQTFSMNLMCDATVVLFGSGDTNLNTLINSVRTPMYEYVFWYEYVVSGKRCCCGAALVSMTAGYHHTFYVVETAAGRTGGRT